MSTLLDEETIVIEHLDFDIPCCTDAGHPAQLVVTCRFCAEVSFICRKHHAELLADLMLWFAMQPEAAVGCTRCGQKSRSYSDLFKVVPL